jgi:hypothetical protein
MIFSTTFSEFLTSFRLCSVIVQVCGDADDERIVEVALQCGAMIVTHNRKDFAGAERLGVVVHTPVEFLRILREAQ